MYFDALTAQGSTRCGEFGLFETVSGENGDALA